MEDHLSVIKTVQQNPKIQNGQSHCLHLSVSACPRDPGLGKPRAIPSLFPLKEESCVSHTPEITYHFTHALSQQSGFVLDAGY